MTAGKEEALKRVIEKLNPPNIEIFLKRLSYCFRGLILKNRCRLFVKMKIFSLYSHFETVPNLLAKFNAKNNIFLNFNIKIRLFLISLTRGVKAMGISFRSHFEIAIVCFYQFVSPVFAQVLEQPRLPERKMLSRCYFHLTGHQLKSSDPLWGQLKNRSAVSICSELLGSLKLGADGVLVQPNNTVQRKILKQFADFHRTWIHGSWVFQNTFPDSYGGGVDIYDVQEPALYLTRNLATSEHYSKVLQGNNTAVGIRDNTKLIPALPAAAGGFLRPSRTTVNGTEGPNLNSTIINYTTSSSFGLADLLALPVPLIQMGEIYGIEMRSYVGTPLLPVIWTEPYTAVATSTTEGVTVPQAFMANRGGGAIGSVPYIMLNLGHGFDYKADGAAKLPRRYILSVFDDFLCRQGPFVRGSDVSIWLSAKNDAPGFRKSESCLRCHASLDQSAMVLRNLRFGGTANAPSNAISDYRTPPVLLTYNADQASPTEFWPSSSQTNFHRSAPAGKLYMRNIDGAIVDVGLSNLENLGQSLANTPDYYACAAARYFEYFTNNKVQLLDPYDISNNDYMESLTVKEKAMRDFVLGLGRSLRSEGGTLKKLVIQIMESDYYSRANFGR